MVNCYLDEDRIRELYDYTRATAAVIHADHADTFTRATRGANHIPHLLVLGTDDGDARIDNSSLHYVNYGSHSDDPAIWLFSGGTTGRPKGVVQSHASFANSTECYAKQVIGYTADDITLSVPKLYFGYATGSNLFFPLAAGRVRGPLPRALHRRRALRADRAAPPHDPHQRPHHGEPHGLAPRGAGP